MEKIAYAKKKISLCMTWLQSQLFKLLMEEKCHHGITDWVYEEEFAVRAFDWSKTVKKLAYIRFDEVRFLVSMSMFQRFVSYGRNV
jgi:hypothetical protein